MNKRYIDFVPAPRRKMAVKKAPKKQEKPKEQEEIPLEKLFAEKTEPAGVSKGLKPAKFGVIEDYHPKFVKTEVKKRPLGVKPAPKATSRAVSVAGVSSSKSGRTISIAKKSVGRPTGEPVVKPAVKPAVKPISKPTVKPAVKSGEKPILKAPAGAIQANFINVNKIEKRPLSKNVYAKKAPVAQAPEKEESKKPTVIIAKPEKDSKVGMIVAVILTIILGAAAGTVAFLLLPK